MDELELAVIRDHQPLQRSEALDYLKEEKVFKEHYVKFDVDKAEAFARTNKAFILFVCDHS